MKSPRSPRLRALWTAIFLSVLVGISLAPAFAQSFFGYSRTYLPHVVKAPAPTTAPTPQPQPDPRIVAWLDIPSKVRISDRMAIVVHVQNKSRTSFGGKTDVTIPYDGRRFYAVDSSFTRNKGDWIRENNYPNQLVVQFGPLGANEERKATIFYDFRANGSNARVGDNLRIEGRYTNGKPECGNDTCSTNTRTVEVVDQFASGGVGQLPDGSQQIQKLGTLRYNELHNWTPAGFRPGERVTTWLNIAGGGTRPLTLQQQADSSGKVYFTIDLVGLRNGFYSIVAHGNDTKIEIVGEFEIVGSSVTSLTARMSGSFLLPAPHAAAQPRASLQAQPAQAIGSATLTGVVAAVGTSGQTRLEGVQVNIVAPDGTVVGSGASDSYGGYVVNGVPTGTYAVSFDPHVSFNDAARRFQPKTAASVTLTNGATTRLDAELAAGSSVSGRITGVGEGGLGDVSVLLLNGNEVVEATTTADDGSYVLEGIPSGSYTLSIDPSTAEDDLVQSFAVTTTAAFALTAPSPLGNQDVVLSRSTDTTTIAGQVVAADTGAPLAEVFVVVERFDTERGAFVYADLALSDATGAYSVVLPAGRYRVSFLPGFSPDPTSERYLNEYFNDASDPAGATEFTLAGGQIARADAALALGGSITGTVTGATRALSDTVVLAYSATNDSLVDVALSDETGSYALTSLPAGTYRVEIAPYLSANPTTQTFAGVTLDTPVTVPADGTVSSISADLIPGGTVSGTVTSNDGSALAGVLVLALNPNDPANTDDDSLAGLTLSAVDGSYSLKGLATGSYTIIFDTALLGTPDVAAHFDTTIEEVPVTAGAATEAVNATLIRGGQIRGEVRDALGSFTLSGVLVEIAATSDPTTPVAFAITDEQGRYASTALPLGSSYIVRFDPAFAADESNYAVEYFNNAPDAASAQPVAVPNIIPVTGINAALEATP